MSLIFPRYLIDANVFIQAKNLHYRFNFCQCFWDWLIEAHQAKLIFSIDKVKTELKRGTEDDPILTWIETDLLKDFFLPDIKDRQVVNQYKKIMEWINRNRHYTDQAKNEFKESDNADAFLIAVASTYDYIIVTHEKENANIRRRVPIPNAASEFKIRTIMIYDLLSQYAQGNFQLKI